MRSAAHRWPGVTPIDGHNYAGIVAACDNDAGISRQTGTRWQTIATLPEGLFEAHIAETNTGAGE